MTSPTIWLNEFLPVNGDLVQQYSLVVSGIIGQKVNAAPPIYIRATALATILKFNVNRASLGNDININLYQDSTLWYSGFITSGSTAETFNTAGLPTLTIGKLWRVDITQVGGIFPGSDLVITIVA
jgi:hypothetical protein